MRYFLTTLLGAIAAILLASLLSWQIYQLYDLDQLIEFPKLAKFVIILLIILLSVFLAYRWNASFKEIFGFITPPNSNQIKSFLLYLGGGILIVIPVATTFFLLEVRVLDEEKLNVTTILFYIVKYTLSALFIATIEEIFFRGILIYGLLKQKVFAIFSSALFFAVLHFIAFVPDIQQTTTPWYYGILSLYQGIEQKYSWETVLSPLLTLFLAGVFLALIRISTRWIIPCIGIHCGWIIGVKLTKKFTSLNSDSEFIYLISDYDRFIGWGSAIWFGLLIVWYILRLNRQN